jgi:hypothetical protein
LTSAVLAILPSKALLLATFANWHISLVGLVGFIGLGLIGFIGLIDVNGLAGPNNLINQIGSIGHVDLISVVGITRLVGQIGFVSWPINLIGIIGFGLMGSPALLACWLISLISLSLLNNWLQQIDCTKIAAAATLFAVRKQAAHRVALMLTSASEIVSATASYYHAVSLLHIGFFFRENL